VTYSDYPPADGKIEKVLTLVNLQEASCRPTASRIEQCASRKAIGADATSEPQAACASSRPPGAVTANAQRLSKRP